MAAAAVLSFSSFISHLYLYIYGKIANTLNHTFLSVWYIVI